MVEGNHFKHALSRNQAWAGHQANQNPEFFKELSTGQTPAILWLGCSDSRVPETTILGLQPGDVFVHRNIANVISPTDINTSSVIEYAVDHLKVKHVVLCGHTGCGGAKAAMSGSRVGGVLDTWLAPLRNVCSTRTAELSDLSDEERAIRVAELNVEQGVNVLMSNMTIQEAVRDRSLYVHGWMFDLGTGCIYDLGCGTDDDEDEVSYHPPYVDCDEKDPYVQMTRMSSYYSSAASSPVVAHHGDCCVADDTSPIPSEGGDESDDGSDSVADLPQTPTSFDQEFFHESQVISLPNKAGIDISISSPVILGGDTSPIPMASPTIKNEDGTASRCSYCEPRSVFTDLVRGSHARLIFSSEGQASMSPA